MPKKKEELTPEQQAERQISAMGDSVWLINKLISENAHTETIHETIDRNIRHLEIMLRSTKIQESGSDLTQFNTAIADGKAFTAVGITTN